MVYRHNLDENCPQAIFGSDIDVVVGLEDIQAAYGVRFPGPLTAQRDFTIAFVIGSLNRKLTATEMTFWETIAAHATSAIPENDPDPFLGFNRFASMVRYFGKDESNWRSDYPILSPIGVDVPQRVRRSIELTVTPNSSFARSSVWYWLPQDVEASLEIYDVSGRLVRLLARGPHRAGEHVIEWNGRTHRGYAAASGVYFIKLRTEKSTKSVRIMLLK